MMPALGAPSQRALLALHVHVERTGQSPVLRELAEAVGCKVTTVNSVVATLRKAGLVTRTKHHGTLALTPLGHRMVAVLRKWEQPDAEVAP